MLKVNSLNEINQHIYANILETTDEIVWGII